MIFLSTWVAISKCQMASDVHEYINPSFYNRQQLISVEFHDGIEIIEEGAFNGCCSLRGAILNCWA